MASKGSADGSRYVEAEDPEDKSDLNSLPEIRPRSHTELDSVVSGETSLSEERGKARLLSLMSSVGEQKKVPAPEPPNKALPKNSYAHPQRMISMTKSDSTDTEENRKDSKEQTMEEKRRASITMK